MSVVTFFTRKAPSIGTGQAALTFDAILEDTLSFEAETTEYPIESGANVSDHIIIKPTKWKLKGIHGNKAISPQATDFIGGALTSALGIESGVAGLAAGLSAGLLSGSDGSRASAALIGLLDLMVNRESFDVDAGDIQLKNMVLLKITRVKNPQNEDALEFEAELQEHPTLDNIGNLASAEAPNPEDENASQLQKAVNKGEKAIADAGAAINDFVSGLF